MNLQELFLIVLHFSLIGSVVALVILLIKKVLNDRLSAHWHYYIWILLILRLLFPFSFESSLSWNNFLPSITENTFDEAVDTPVNSQNILPSINVEPKIDINQHESLNEINELPLNFQSKTNLTNSYLHQEAIGIETNESSSENAAAKQLMDLKQTLINFFTLNTLGMLWLYGALQVFTFLFIINIEFNWKLSKKKKCKDEEVLSLLEACKKKLIVNSNVKVIYDEKIDSPSIVGFLVPKIVISRQLFESLSKEEKKYVLLHELMHFKKKDVFVQWISIIVLSIHWFNPIVWYSFYRLRKDCELSCDASVLSQLKKDEQLAYGNALLNVLGKVSKPPLIPKAIGMSAGLSDLRSRIMRIHMFKKQSMKWIMLSSVITASVVLVGFTVFAPNNSSNAQNTFEAADGNIQFDQITEIEPKSIELQDSSFIDLAKGKWKDASSMNQAGYPNDASTVIDDKIYIAGGSVVQDGVFIYSSSLEVYDPLTDSWTQLASMNQTRDNHTTVVIDGKIYVIGGFSYDGEELRYLSDVEMYDPEMDTWTQLAGLNQARAYHETEVLDGKIYVLGGHGDGEDDRVLSSVEVYDPTTNTWTQLATMNEARFHFESAVMNGKIYALGGQSDNVLSSTEVYDPATDTWTMLAKMNKGREFFSVEIMNEKLYAVGGFNSNSMRSRKENYLSSVEVYDPKTDNWNELADLNQARDNHATEVINGYIYTIGGFGGNNDLRYLSSVEVYDPDTNRWIESANINQARHNHATEVINGKIYALGGNTEEEYVTRSVEVYEMGEKDG
ncbi:M56 family metallopeptidase [Chengkuizengella axinellae]|uniref:M56 family metallopeptidase n=1 Tax=Chengkuizengella axinellae TaxID=3064388 RepID=A0ABT9IW15_9BACL|nr:M56 family metallopeptidase [Chengkuizengella sp. 2205SS18-9]MDP5273528.1 M56 family metallopeptidase [Chengkuizengella sp. 2205SS18-9]